MKMNRQRMIYESILDDVEAQETGVGVLST